MGWKTRKRGGRYYNRSRREEGQVVREYVGASRAGELAEQRDALECEYRLREKEAKGMRQQAISGCDIML